jgi:hypothetical protein
MANKGYCRVIQVALMGFFASPATEKDRNGSVVEWKRRIDRGINGMNWSSRSFLVNKPETLLTVTDASVWDNFSGLLTQEDKLSVALNPSGCVSEWVSECGSVPGKVSRWSRPGPRRHSHRQTFQMNKFPLFAKCSTHSSQLTARQSAMWSND